MRAIDTNVLVRLIREDNHPQAVAANAFVKDGAFVSTLALVETVWVLGSIYRRDAADLATTIEMLLNQEQLAFQDSEVIFNALTLFRLRPSLGFTDCLLLETARKAGHLPLGTFDRDLARETGAQWIVAQS